jgi:hypothetical protein
MPRRPGAEPAATPAGTTTAPATAAPTTTAPVTPAAGAQSR